MIPTSANATAQTTAHHPDAPHRFVKDAGMNRRALLLGATVVASAFIIRPAHAKTPDTLLKVTDASGHTEKMSEADIAALPWQTITTATRWTEGVQRFRGPFLRDILTLRGATKDDLIKRKLRMTALNDFDITIPAADAWDYDPILAREVNGTMMRVRDKGPLWLVYPRDQRSELQNAVMDSRWIWQLSEIVVQ